MATQISDKHLKEIEKIIVDIDCPANFACYKSGFEDLCKAKIIKGRTLVECPEENKPYCGFRISVGYRYFCKCPLRIYVAMNLNI